MHMSHWRWVGRPRRQLPPRCPTCLQLAEPRVCAPSQFGGAMYMVGNGDSAVAMTINGVTISGCSAEAGGDGGVCCRHAAQRGPSVGVLG